MQILSFTFYWFRFLITVHLDSFQFCFFLGDAFECVILKLTIFYFSCASTECCLLRLGVKFLWLPAKSDEPHMCMIVHMWSREASPRPKSQSVYYLKVSIASRGNLCVHPLAKWWQFQSSEGLSQFLHNPRLAILWILRDLLQQKFAKLFTQQNNTSVAAKGLNYDY